MSVLDPHLARYAARAKGMTASEIRALFAVASRPEVVSLAGGMPDVSVLDYDQVAAVAAEVMASQGDVALQYGGGQGSPELREQLCTVMRTEHVSARPDDLVVTAGGQQALDLLARLFIDAGDVIVAEGPSYVGALSAFGQYEPHIVHVPMDEGGLIPEALAETLDRLRDEGRTPKMLYTIPNHQNPAGVSLDLERRQAILRLAEDHDLMVIEDNPYGMLDFKHETRTPLVTLAPERVIYIGTLSKIFSPGMRVGWVLAPRSVRDRLVLLKEASDLCQSNVTQAIAEAWLRTQPWMDQVRAFTELYRERCDVMLAEIETAFPAEAAVAAPTGGLFAWVSLPPAIDTGAMLPRAINARVAYVPGRAFFADGGGTQQMRLNFSYADSTKIAEGIRRLGKLIGEELTLLEAFGR
ncbi:PLP-dependent aminotransferase family protein [Euzebya tangerina]|uniref:aminotransferase-like domain-containing protein n=1 Tax=Euzebya tangerina TaxID=591198 RepID=UPI00196AA9E2|nr:PLP-dependent aminotransferase family protein [Euzebya tangerina]